MKKNTVVALALSSLLILVGCQAADDPTNTGETEEVLSEEATSVFALSVGTCVDDAATPLSADLPDVPTVACDQPHDSELYAIVAVDDGLYPGVDDLISVAQTECQTEFADFIGIDFRSSMLDFHFYYPTPSSWAQGDRSIFCMVRDPGLKVVGSLEGSQR
jgi:hypothetical protein